MKILTLLSFTVLLVSGFARGSEWYVAPDGDDAAAGSFEHSFASIQRAQKEVKPGDTVFIRGGIYRPAEAQMARMKGIFGSIILLNKSGEPGKPITYCAYKDERPVFDCTQVKPVGLRITAFAVSGSWLHLRGLEVTGVQVTIKTHTQSICFENNGSHNLFEMLSMHDGQAIGIYSVRGSDNLFLNCDAWNNWDYTSEDGKGGNVDGFGCHPTKGSTGNVFRGCRAWFNSDDGYDCLGAAESVTFENCWALYNGLSSDRKSQGDGNGFKAGGYGSTPIGRLPSPIPRHKVSFCLAVGNKASGFYSNHHLGGSDWTNNTAYHNSRNFNMRCRTADNQTEVEGYGHKLVNNLSFGSRVDLTEIDRAKCELHGNSFDEAIQPVKKDFVSLDEKCLLQPRQADGSLPIVDFMRPTPESVFHQKGIGAFVSNTAKPGK